MLVLEAPNLEADPGAARRFVKDARDAAGEARGSAQGTAWVLRSLTANHRAILELLADSVTDAAPSVGFDALLSACNEALLSSTDAVLRGQLGELCDHGIVGLDRRNGLVTLLIKKGELATALLQDDKA